MPRYWPHASFKTVQVPEEFDQIMAWCFWQFGELAYQHWNWCLQGNKLTIYFASHQDQVSFELTWLDAGTQKNYT